MRLLIVCLLAFSACGNWSASVSGSVTSGGGGFETKQEVIGEEAVESNISESNIF